MRSAGLREHFGAEGQYECIPSSIPFATASTCPASEPARTVRSPIAPRHGLCLNEEVSEAARIPGEQEWKTYAFSALVEPACCVIEQVPTIFHMGPQ